MITGDPSLFAIEFVITTAFSRLSFRGLGFFNICFGVFILNAWCDDLINKEKSDQTEEVMSLIARSVLDPHCYILLAESRLDARMRLYTKIPTDQLSPVTGALVLRQFMPISILRGENVNMDSIWIQIDYYQADARKKHFYYMPILTTEGAWLCFVRPVSKLPRSMSRDTSQLSGMINEADKATPPHELAKKLGFDAWLNERTWFELEDDFSIFMVADMPIRDLELPASLSKTAREQLVARNERIRTVQKSEAMQKFRQGEFTLTAAQFQEIEKLIKLFQSPDKLPSVDELVAMKSEFANAILRELAKASNENLNDGLRKVKGANK